MDTEISVSIVIPVYNSAKYLTECLESLLIQDSKNYEVICVNDGSTDLSMDILNNYKSQFYNMRIINQENKGLSAARNVGVKNAIGEYIYFVDSDDIVKEKFIETAYDKCCQNNLDLLMFSFENFCEDKRLIKRYGKRIKTQKRTHSYNDVIDGITLMTYLLKNNEYYNMVWIQMVRKDLLQNNHILFKEGVIFEDVIYTYRLLISCKRVLCIDEIGYRKRIHSESICGRAENIYNILSMWDNLITIKNLNNTLDLKNAKCKYIAISMENKALNQLRLHFSRLSNVQKNLIFNIIDNANDFIALVL